MKVCSAKKKIIIIFLFGCLIGFIFELSIGWIIKFATGNFLWIYPNSIFKTTSIYAIPLWGLGGLISYAIAMQINKHFP